MKQPIVIFIKAIYLSFFDELENKTRKKIVLVCIES